MKKYLSVFALPARRTLPRLLLILIAMAAVQIALFSAALTKAVDAGGDFPLLEDVVADSRIAWILGAALLLCMAVLCSAFGKKASVLSAYTTCRLPVGEPAFYWGQALYNCCALLILLGAEIASVLVMVSLYDKEAALAGASQHLVFLGFYQSSLLHGLLPLADTLIHVENLCMLLALGLSAARFAKMQSRGKFDIAAPFAVILAGLTFCGRFGYDGSVTRILLIALPIIAVVSALSISKGGTLDEEETHVAAGDGEKLAPQD